MLGTIFTKIFKSYTMFLLLNYSTSVSASPTVNGDGPTPVIIPEKQCVLENISKTLNYTYNCKTSLPQKVSRGIPVIVKGKKDILGVVKSIEILSSSQTRIVIETNVAF